jgi:hypothetical protein
VCSVSCRRLCLLMLICHRLDPRPTSHRRAPPSSSRVCYDPKPTHRPSQGDPEVPRRCSPRASPPTVPPCHLPDLFVIATSLLLIHALLTIPSSSSSDLWSKPAAGSSPPRTSPWSTLCGEHPPQLPSQIIPLHHRPDERLVPDLSRG